VRIGIDLTPLQTAHRFRGVGSYVRNLVRALGTVDDEATYVLFAYRSPPSGLRALPRNFRLVPIPGAALGKLTGLISHQFVLPLLAGRHRLDVFHATSVATTPSTPGIPWRLATPTVVTVHDLIPTRHPEWLLPARRNRWIYGLMCRAIRRARHLIADSSWTKAEVVQVLGYPSERIAVIPLAPDPLFRRASAGDEERSPLGATRYLLHVGGHHWNKNLPRLLDAYAILRSAQGIQHALVLVGEASSGLDALLAARGDLRRCIVQFERVPTRELAALYRHADLLAFPSLAEGFGLPVLEAMASGCPVVSSNRPPLAELAGEAAVLVDPEDASAIARGMEQVLLDPALAEALRKRGLDRVAAFSWKETARRTAAVYRAGAAGEISGPSRCAGRATR
jgi:glycosyltransferase involved in cell wall biosynthesis